MRHASPRLAFWIWNIAAWLGIGLFGATQTVFVMRSIGMHHAWAALFVTELLSWAPWAIATPIVIWMGRRFPPLFTIRWRYLALHVGVLSAVAATAAGWVAALEFALNPWVARPQPFGVLWEVRFENGLLQSIFLYIAILATSFVLDARERLMRQETEAARLSDQLGQARFRALQQQIEPHFLFNALNAVAGLVREQRTSTAVRALADLSDCLRQVLRESNRHLVTLNDELELVGKYLDLQKLRFGESLRVTTDVPADLLDCPVPHLVLQPIVDNAVKHGIAQRVGGGEIEIGAVRTDDTLTLTVYNDGPRLTTVDSPSKCGIGLANLRARLGLLYGTAFQLSVENVRNGVSVAMSLPLNPLSRTR